MSNDVKSWEIKEASNFSVKRKFDRKNSDKFIRIFKKDSAEPLGTLGLKSIGKGGAGIKIVRPTFNINDSVSFALMDFITTSLCSVLTSGKARVAWVKTGSSTDEGSMGIEFEKPIPEKYVTMLQMIEY